MTSASIELFFCYAHQDEALLNRLEVALASLKREQLITTWHDRKIDIGTEWKAQLDAHLEQADIILLLISPDFIASDYCYDIEVQRAMTRHAAGEACVIPIILRPVDWSGTPFQKLQALPKDLKPVTRWDDRDEAFLNIVQGIRQAIDRLKQRSTQPQSSSSKRQTEQQFSPQAKSIDPPTAPENLTASQRQRLEEQRHSLEAEWQLRQDKVTRLRKATAIETGLAQTFQLEHQIQQEEEEIDRLERRMEEIEQKLRSA